MTVAEPVDDEDLRLLLIGDEAEREQAFEYIHAQWSASALARLRQRFPGLSSEDLRDVWQDTMVDLLKAVRDGSFDPDRLLWPFVWTIARARATDQLRQHTRTMRDDVVRAIADAIRDTSFDALSRAELAEFLAQLPRLIITLPFKQRVVIQVWLDGYPETSDMQRLQREVSAVTGEEETVVAVKRALQEARKKAREFLARKGYGQGTTHDEPA